MNPTYEIRDWTSQANEAQEFLQSHYETSLFLLGNLESFGPKAGDSPNSGNYKVVIRAGAVVAAFCLTKRGNLLVQAGADADVVALICSDAAHQTFPIAGVLAPWPAASAIWDHLNGQKIVTGTSFRSKEILYRQDSLSAVGDQSSCRVRLLVPDDYSDWRPLRLAYLEEEGLRQDLSDEDFKNSFYRLAERRVVWGGFSDENHLVAMAGLNTRAGNIGQVGGVYTVPAVRGRGIAKAVMRGMIRDCQAVHKIDRMVLFTGEKNVSAQRLYEGLGFTRCGYYGLIFS